MYEGGYPKKSTREKHWERTHHILKNMTQLVHRIRVVTPNFMHRFQEPLPFVTLLHGVLLQSGREGREDSFLRKTIEILDDKVLDAIIEHCAVLAHYQLVAKPVTFFKRKLVSILVLNFTDIQRKFRPGFIGRDICTMLDWGR